MHELELTPEDGTPGTSLENAVKMTMTHGCIVAVTHIITPKNEHITKIFYYDGETHVAEGLAIGLDVENPDKDQTPKVMAFEIIIDMIPGSPLHINKDLLALAGRCEDDQEIFKTEKNVVYHFLAPDSATLSLIQNCEGMIVFERSDDILKEEENVVKVCDYV